MSHEESMRRRWWRLECQQEPFAQLTRSKRTAREPFGKAAQSRSNVGADTWLRPLGAAK